MLPGFEQHISGFFIKQRQCNSHLTSSHGRHTGITDGKELKYRKLRWHVMACFQFWCKSVNCFKSYKMRKVNKKMEAAWTFETSVSYRNTKWHDVTKQRNATRKEFSVNGLCFVPCRASFVHLYKSVSFALLLCH